MANGETLQMRAIPCQALLEVRMEIWKDIDRYPGLYQISNLGRVRSLPRVRTTPFGSYMYRGKIMSQHIDNQGYPKISLGHKKNKKDVFVHRLVSTYFIPNPEDKPEVNHRNGIKSDNRVENLEWCTRLENQRHAEDKGLVVRPSKQVLTEAHRSEYKGVIATSLDSLERISFESIASAVRYLRNNGYPKAGDANITLSCKSHGKSAYGFTWKFLEREGVSTIPKGSRDSIDTNPEAHSIP